MSEYLKEKEFDFIEGGNSKEYIIAWLLQHDREIEQLENQLKQKDKIIKLLFGAVKNYARDESMFGYNARKTLEKYNELTSKE